MNSYLNEKKEIEDKELEKLIINGSFKKSTGTHGRTK